MSTHTREQMERQRDELVRDARHLLNTAEREKRELTPDEARRCDELESHAKTLSHRIESYVENRRLIGSSYGSDSPGRSRDGEDWRARPFYDAILAVPRGEARALTTASSLSPGELGTFLFDRLRAESVALASGVRVVSTDKDSITWPRLTADVAPGWVNEAATISPGDPTLDSITATPRKLAHLVQFSNEILEDSEPAAAEVVAMSMIKAIGLKLDLGIFEGSGTAPEIRGLRNVAGIQTVSMGTNGATPTNLDPWADAIGLLEAANTPATAIVMHPRTWATLRKIKEVSGSTRPVLSDGAGSPSDGIRPRLYGVPVFLSGQLSTTETQGTSTDASTSYVYTASEVVMVRRTEIEVEMDRSRLFNSDQSELRGRMRADLIVPNPAAVVRVIGIRP